VERYRRTVAANWPRHLSLRRCKGNIVSPRYRHCYVRAIVEALVPTSAASHHRHARACSHIHSDARRRP